MGSNTPTTPESFLGRSFYPPTYQLVRHIVSFLKWRFSLLPAGGYRWDPASEDTQDQAGSEIFIGSDTPLYPQQIGARPAITVLRSAASFQGAGIGDWLHTDFRTGMKARADILPTNIMINILSRHPVEAERIAWFCSTQVFALREEIVKAEPSILYLGSRGSIGAPSPAGAFINSTEHEWTVVVVTYPVWLNHSTVTLPLNQKILRGVTTTLTETPTPPRSRATVPLQGTAAFQPQVERSEVVAALDQSTEFGFPRNAGNLPQTVTDGAQSVEPLTVTIKTTE